MANDAPFFAPGVAAGPGIASRWWLVLLRGLFGIVFGLFALLMPGPTLASLVLLFGIYLLLDGVTAIFSGIRAARLHRSWGWFLFEGLVDIAVAVIALAWPALTIFAFVWIAGAWALLSGVLMIAPRLSVGARAAAAGGSRSRASSRSSGACCCSSSRSTARS